MIRRHGKNPANILVLLLILFATLVIPAAAEGASPGDYGVGIMTLGPTRANQVSITSPSEISNWELSPANPGGINTEGGTLTVGADGNWEVTVYDSGSTTNGYMTDWYNGNYNPSIKLGSQLSVSVADGAAEGIVDTGNDVSLSITPSTLAIGSATGWPPNTAQIPFTLTQPVSWGDHVSESGHSYKIVVTFAISGYG